MHRKIRQTAFAPPRTRPYSRIANLAYSEQVGVKRHDRGNRGETQRL